MKKSFKERNPDVDMDEIQNNPNVPDDVKAAITGALALTLDDDVSSEGEEVIETYDNDFLLDVSDEEVRGNKPRRKRKHENDEDWSAKSKTKKAGRKKKRKGKKKAKVDVKKPKTQKNVKKVKAIEPIDNIWKTDCSTDAKVHHTNKAIQYSDNNMESVVKLEKLEIEPVLGVAKPIKVEKMTKKRSNGKEKTPRVKTKVKPVSSIDAILATIETVVLGLDENNAVFDESPHYTDEKTVHDSDIAATTATNDSIDPIKIEATEVCSFMNKALSSTTQSIKIQNSNTTSHGKLLAQLYFPWYSKYTTFISYVFSPYYFRCDWKYQAAAIVRSNNHIATIDHK